jgi:acyl dehydratase
MSAFIRGEGGWGGERGPSGPRNEAPDRDPDATITYPTRPEQALVYRLSGDRNPLHSDPSFAALAGFDRPILHGLCTYGFTGRALLHELCGSDPARFRSMEGRFSSPVMPGEELTVQVWRTGDGQAVYRTLASGDRVVLDSGAVTFDA